MNHLLSLLVICSLFLAGPARAETSTGEALLQIDRTLQQILVRMDQQVTKEASREESRLLLQRLSLQADRLAPLEDELKQLRLRRATLEQQLAAGDEKLRQVEKQDLDSAFAPLVESQMAAEAQELNAMEMGLRSLEVRIRDQEGILLRERAIYDDLAAGIDRRLGLERQ